MDSLLQAPHRCLSTLTLLKLYRVVHSPKASVYCVLCRADGIGYIGKSDSTAPEHVSYTSRKRVEPRQLRVAIHVLGVPTNALSLKASRKPDRAVLPTTVDLAVEEPDVELIFLCRVA